MTNLINKQTHIGSGFMLLCNETGMFLGGVQQLFRLMWCFSIIKLENKFRAQKKGEYIIIKILYLSNIEIQKNFLDNY